MRAVIMEVNPGYSIAVNKDGTFIRMKTLPHYKVGNEIEMSAVAPARNYLRYSSVAAMFALLICMGSFLFAYAMPYSYIDIDINPSIEITTNRFDYIIHVKGINNDGEQVLNNKSMINKPLKSGVDLLIDELASKDYLSENKESSLVFTIASDDKSKIAHLGTDINEIVQKKLEDKSNVEVFVVNTDLSTHESAKNYNISTGKFMLIKELQKTKTDLNTTDVKDLPIKQIIQMVKEDNDKQPSGETPLKQIKVRNQKNTNKNITAVIADSNSQVEQNVGSKAPIMKQQSITDKVWDIANNKVQPVGNRPQITENKNAIETAAEQRLPDKAVQGDNSNQPKQGRELQRETQIQKEEQRDSEADQTRTQKPAASNPQTKSDAQTANTKKESNAQKQSQGEQGTTKTPVQKPSESSGNETKTRPGSSGGSETKPQSKPQQKSGNSGSQTSPKTSGGSATDSGPKVKSGSNGSGSSSQGDKTSPKEKPTKRSKETLIN